MTKHAIVSDSGHEIYRLGDGRFQAWGPPGSLREAYGAATDAAIARDLESIGLTPDNPLGVTYHDARACLGVFSTADQARAACE